MSYFHNIFKNSNNTILNGIFQVSWKISKDLYIGKQFDYQLLQIWQNYKLQLY
jgi:hypothetical protein